MGRHGYLGLASLAIALAGSPVLAHAQPELSPAFWDEGITLLAGSATTTFTGADLNAPDPGTRELSGTGYTLTGSVSFGSGGPPEGTVAIAWDIAPQGPSAQLVSTLAIDFQCVVIATGDPPPGVTFIPVRVVAAGAASVTEGTLAVANCSFRFQAPGLGLLVADRADADGLEGTVFPAADSFSIDETAQLTVDSVVLVGLTAATGVSMVATSEARVGNGTATADPVIEIVDATIPGTSERYRDHYALVFSDGYDALSPVERITIGELKRRFGERR